MKIGYILSNNKMKDELRPWMKLEMRELIRRGYEVIPYRNTDIKKGDVDIIIAHYLSIGKKVDILDIPYITISHGSNYDSTVPVAEDLSQSKNCKGIGLDSKYNYDLFFNCLTHPDKVRYFPQPARTEFFTRTKQLGDKVVGGGRIKPQKGFHLAVEACPNITLFGGELTNDMTYINKLKSLSPNITFTGWIFDNTLKALYEDSWLYLHPSLIVGDKHEGPSNVFKEAMLMELQVISTDIGGISELKYINFVEPTVEAIKQMIENTPKKNNIKGRDYIRENYNPKVCVDVLEKSILA